jgi:hypothetical protein
MELANYNACESNSSRKEIQEINFFLKGLPRGKDLAKGRHYTKST